MGSYTTVLHEGVEIQFHTGDGDNYSTYKLGDELPFKIDPTFGGRGHFFDGVYDGHGRRDPVTQRYQHVWVVVKDHRITALVEQVQLDEEAVPQYQRVLEAHGIEEPPREWWSEEAWAARDKWDAECAARLEEKKQEYRDKTGRDPDANFGVSFFMWCRLHEDGLMRQILPSVPIP